MNKEKKEYLLQWIEEKMEGCGFIKTQEAISSANSSDIVTVEYSKDNILVTFYMKFREFVNLLIEAEFEDGTPLGNDYLKLTNTFIFKTVVRKFLREKLGLE